MIVPPSASSVIPPLELSVTVVPANSAVPSAVILIFAAAAVLSTVVIFKTPFSAADIVTVSLFEGVIVILSSLITNVPTVKPLVASQVVNVPAWALLAPITVPSIDPPSILAVVTVPKSAIVVPLKVEFFPNTICSLLFVVTNFK